MLDQNLRRTPLSRQVRQLAALATMLTAITLTLLLPAAQSVHAGRLTQTLPWLMLGLSFGLSMLAAGFRLRQRQSRG
ncbi:hypothetical protein [Deinococcus sp.]|uniref:hypothetical protein n=1 Tax=Deinococcus sp. TaxID=47478 RepID=UPI0025F6044E|nr:hypothetical protein [Deinococcus sp.]